MNLKTSHRFPVDSKTFWEKIYFDREYNETLYRDCIGVKSYEIMNMEEDGEKISRKVRVVPQQKAPGVIQKLISGEFSYVEEGTFQKKEGIYRFKIVPSIKADKITINGMVTAKDEGEKSVLRTIDLELKADIFAVGGQIEKFVGSEIQKGYEDSYRFTLDWIQKKGL